MAILGTLLKHKRAGETGLAWNQPNLAGPPTIALTSADFVHGGELALAQAGRRAGGGNVSPALAWTGTPGGTAQLLLVVQDVDSPTGTPFVHCVALLDPELTALPAGGLSADGPAGGVRVLRSGMGRGYLGPEPIKGHGQHLYVFQLFALAAPITRTVGGAELESARPKAVLAAVGGPSLGRGRLDGCYQR
jgi:phosphatidylethanolamine-binding protein (PEBP) family uncharacterized protein